MINEHDLDKGLARIEASKNRRYTDDQRTEIGAVVLEWDREAWLDAVEQVLRTHEAQALPTPAHFVKAAGASTRGSGRTWAQNAAGGDRERCRRIGRMSQSSHEPTRAYAERLMGAMSHTDREIARDAARGDGDEKEDSRAAFRRAFPEQADEIERRMALRAKRDQVPHNLDPGIPLRDRDDLEDPEVVDWGKSR